MQAQIVPDSTGVEGNTHSSTPTNNNKKCKQTPSRKSHFFTYNNYDIEIVPTIISKFKLHKAIKYAFQEEIGKNGTPHLQGVVTFKERIRDTALGLPKEIHWEAPKDLDACYDYCTKDDTHSGGRWTYGFPKPIEIITELRPWQLEVEAIALAPPNNRTVHWYWSECGDIGKSALVKYLVVKYGFLYCQGGRESDIMNLVFNQNMDDTTCVVFDIPRDHRGNISYSALESIKNGLICNTKYETGYKAFNSPNLIIFANSPPSRPEALSKDRWHIVELKQE